MRAIIRIRNLCSYPILASPAVSQPASVSVIIPTLNEVATIGACVAAVRALDPCVEIIVADGGSSDDTIAVATAAGAIVCSAPRGRGPQLNAGAAQASGEVLVFLHADTQLPKEGFALIETHFTNPDIKVAKFRLRFDAHHPLLDIATRFTWIDSTWTTYGDQCLVVRRSFFEARGGFPEWPLFEDVGFLEKARQSASVEVLPAEVVTSARRFMRNGVAWQFQHDFWCMVDYLMGVPPAEIAERYRATWSA